MIFDPALASIVDGHFARAFDSGVAPGLCYGVVRGADLVHQAGLGTTDVASSKGACPDADTVFSIASMTKSFTAATLLSLRDDGMVDLDQTVARYLPELRRSGWIEQVTVRDLLTMSGGFITDDPWGDRRQAWPLEDFRDWLSQAVEPTWRPGRQFEYSNLGYAILGLMIEQVTAQPYREVATERVLRPLQLSGSGFDAAQVAPHRLATGYVRRAGAWVVEPLADYGAFAPMGGLLSTVRDIARWVSTMLAAEADLQVLATLRPGTLREQATGQRFIEVVAQPPGVGEAPMTTEVRHYGFGLFVEELSWGRSVAHSGGYPGFGSHMRWHPRSGLGIVAMANRTYAPMHKVATAALADLVAHEDLANEEPSPLADDLDEAQRVVTGLLNDWDDSLLVHHFTENVGQDEPWSLRQADAQRIRQRHGRLRPTAGPGDEDSGPGQRVWWLAGERPGRVRCEVLLAPLPGHPIQSVAWQSVPEPPVAVRRLAQEELARRDPHAVLGEPIAGSADSTTFRATSPTGQLDVVVNHEEAVEHRPVPTRVSPFHP